MNHSSLQAIYHIQTPPVMLKGTAPGYCIGIAGELERTALFAELIRVTDSQLAIYILEG